MSEWREITLVFGKTGMGKTTWTRDYLKTKPRVLILDPMDEYAGRLLSDESATEEIEKDRFCLRSPDPRELPILCRVAMLATKVTVVVDEAQRALPQSAGYLPPEFEDIVYRGRHASASLILIAQRPTTVHIAARSQWTRLITFCQSEIADVRWLEQTSGLPIGDTVQRLPVRHYLEISGGEAAQRTLGPEVRLSFLRGEAHKTV